MERSVLKMPAVALRGMTILPGMITHFDVSRSRSAKAVERSVAQDQKLFVVTQKDPETENPDNIWRRMSVKSRISWKKGCRKRLCSEICRIFLKGIQLHQEK